MASRPKVPNEARTDSGGPNFNFTACLPRFTDVFLVGIIFDHLPVHLETCGIPLRGFDSGCRLGSTTSQQFPGRRVPDVVPHDFVRGGIGIPDLPDHTHEDPLPSHRRPVPRPMKGVPVALASRGARHQNDESRKFHAMRATMWRNRSRSLDRFDTAEVYLRSRDNALAYGIENKLWNAVDIELLQNVPAVSFDGGQTDSQQVGDFLVGTAFGDQL